jgi:hypothetical protein
MTTSAAASSRKCTRAIAKTWVRASIEVALLMGGVSALAQQGPSATVIEIDAPTPANGVSGAVDARSDQASRPVNYEGCTVSGTVLDTNYDVIQGARVVLTSSSGAGDREIQSGPNGQFAFAALPAGSYRVTVTGKDMGTFVSPWFTMHPGEFRLVTSVVLPVATTNETVTVSAETAQLKEELSEQQVQIAVEQRVWGVFPNFYSSYDWNAPPMEPKQKFQLALRSMIDPMAFAGAAGIAGFEQRYDIFPGYGGGAAGFFKRYGAAYANDFDSRMLSSGVFATLFRQDPRYFYKGTGSFSSRAMYSIACAFITRSDNRHWRPNYSRVLGVFAATALSNLYYPRQSRGVRLTLANGAVELAGNAGTNIAREFILKEITSNAGGKP